MRIPKDLRPLARKAKDEGWTIEPTKSGHLRWKAPTGEIIITPSTPSDWRSLKNTRAALKRAGLTD